MTRRDITSALERLAARCIGPRRWFALSLAATLTRVALFGPERDLDEIVASVLEVDP